ncbi:cation:proton antiporter [Halogeometricum sp. S1BR25-6]|uniref:Cation:proton antiporter n=1 Tax=Halogeometricum salsisoli TaxID=2950536 RepID=A0ABU2GG64_9EURY|nr:cation:proton antiporter [Halogeometricum sp. S1BR25-6]MDS0299093.1 cation:proton antiporter [Halogeometricum sp. S1BR25-6]
MALEPYFFAQLVVGLALVGLAVLPRFVSDWPVSLPIFYVSLGFAAFSLPLGLPAPDPLKYGTVAEKLTELGVILALTGAGLKLDRTPSLRDWASTWRLLGVTMPLSIAAAALLGWGVAGFALTTALLLGAVLAPTDPVLASEMQVEEPGAGAEDEPVEGAAGKTDEVRFALTSEAGLNDSLAFPFTNLAIAVALLGVDPGLWLGEWALVDVGYKLAVGLLSGYLVGRALGWVVFAGSPDSELARSVRGMEALGGTLLVYAFTELVGGYGFLAVFVAALVVRDAEREHDYNETLHDVAEKSEQTLMTVLMVLFGGALAAGLLDPLTTAGVAVALTLVFVVRPLAGAVGLFGFDRDPFERGVIASFGIRGLGSFYYLAHALNVAPFPEARRLWALVGAVVLVSVVVHGVSATPALKLLERRSS